MQAQALDTAMHRLTILEMTADQLDAHVSNMRARRMAAHIEYKRAQEAKQRAQTDKDIATYTKKLEQLAKAFESFDKAAEKIEKLHTDVKVLRLSLGDKL